MLHAVFTAHSAAYVAAARPLADVVADAPLAHACAAQVLAAVSDAQVFDCSRDLEDATALLHAFKDGVYALTAAPPDTSAACAAAVEAMYCRDDAAHSYDSDEE